MVSFTKLATLAFAATALAADGIQIYHKDELAYQACSLALTKAATLFGKKDKAGYCNKKNPAAFGSMAYCVHKVPHAGALEAFVKDCDVTLAEVEAAYENATEYIVTNTSQIAGFNKTVLYTERPIAIPKKTLLNAYESNVNRWYNYNRANYYGWVLLAYWFLLVLFAGAIRLTKWVAPRFVDSFNGKISNAWRKYVTMPALFRRKRVAHGRIFKVFEFVIPSRMETISLFVWFVLAVAFNTADFSHQDKNFIWPKKTTEMGRKIADRTGIMVLYLIPELFLFAGRNNFLQWVSGWSYARFNVIHHWMGRVVFILSMVHAVGMTYNGKGVGKYDSRNAKPYVRWGYVSLIAMVIMLVHSFAVLRRNRYEMFVLAHNVLGAIMVAGTWLHVADDDMHQFMIATTAVWAFDKVMRLARMAVFGVRTAEVQLIADETLKVKVSRPAWWKPHHGSHAFIYFFRSTIFWQSHPFTIMDSVIEENTISFCIKVKGGMTHGLYKYLSTQPDQKAQIKCSVEGPYGTRHAMQHYETITYLSGGSGVPGLFSSAVASARQQLKSDSQQKLKFYWVIRHWKSLEWFYEELKQLEGLNIEPVVYVTQYNTPLDVCFVEKFDGEFEKSSTDGSEKDTSEKDSEEVNTNVARLVRKLHYIDFRAGRPDMENIITTEVAEANGSVAIVACGHDSFVDETRRLVVRNLPEGKRVDFYDTMQVW